MLVDLHAHYPMHVAPRRLPGFMRLVSSKDGRTELVDYLDARVIGLAGRVWNHESFSAGPRVTVERMVEGEVGVALSVLGSPLLEIGHRPIEAIKHFIQGYNERARPFVWTKTVEQILAKATQQQDTSETLH